MHIPTTAMCQHSGLYFTDWWCMKIVKWPVCILPFTIIRAQNPQFLEFLDAVFFSPGPYNGLSASDRVDQISEKNIFPWPYLKRRRKFADKPFKLHYHPPNNSSCCCFFASLHISQKGDFSLHEWKWLERGLIL